MQISPIKSIALASLLLTSAADALELYSAKLWTTGRSFDSAWFNANPAIQATNQATLTLEPGETAGVWPTDLWDNINVSSVNLATITGREGGVAAGTATFNVVQKRNQSPYNWVELRDATLAVTPGAPPAGNEGYMNNGNATLLDAHLVGTEFDGGNGPVDPTKNVVIEVTGLTMPLYDVVIYFGINAAHTFDGIGFINFNGGGVTTFTHPAGQPSTTLDEIESAGTTGNYIKYSNVTGSSFTARIYGGEFTGIGPAGIQIQEVEAAGLITSFSIPGSVGVIDQNTKTISLTAPFGTNLATLAPNFTLGSGTCNQTSGSPPSPTFASANPATYTVTDGAIVNNYTVTVNVTPVGTACDMLTFNANFPGSSATITTTSPTAGTVAVRVPIGSTGAQVAAIAPSYTLSSFATCPQANPGVPTPALSTNTPVSYTITAQDGFTTKTYAVSVTVDATTSPFMALTGNGPTGDLNEYIEADGYRFETGDTALTVNWLGLFDAPNGGFGTVGDGLLASHRVSIWLENGGTLVAQTTVLSTDALDGNFRGRNIFPVTLLPNTGYVIAADYDGTGDRLREGADPAEWNLNSEISDLAGRYGGAGGAMPTEAWSVLIGPNFGTTPSQPTTSVTYNLGASPGTEILPGVGGFLPWIEKGALSPGSILRSVSVNAVLESVGDDADDDYASDLLLYIDPTPTAPGTAALLQIGGYEQVGTVDLSLADVPNAAGWANGQNSIIGTTVIDLKTEVAWSTLGAVDLNTARLSVGNDYSKASWSGTITLTYDLVGGTPYANWSGGEAFKEDKNGDGVKNGLAFLLGADDPDDNALGRLPVPAKTATGLRLNFSILKAAARGTATPTIQWSNDLGLTDPWVTNLAAVPPSTSVVNGVDFQVNSSGALDVIEATIPSSEAAAGKLFGRLSGEEN